MAQEVAELRLATAEIRIPRPPLSWRSTDNPQPSARKTSSVVEGAINRARGKHSHLRGPLFFGEPGAHNILNQALHIKMRRAVFKFAKRERSCGAQLRKRPVKRLLRHNRKLAPKQRRQNEIWYLFRVKVGQDAHNRFSLRAWRGIPVLPAFQNVIERQRKRGINTAA